MLRKLTHYKDILRVMAVLIIACGAMSVTSARTVEVSTVAQLVSAVDDANGRGGGDVILLTDGTYTLSETLYVNAPNIVIAGKSEAREKVVIQGDAMSANARVGNLLRVAGSGFQLHDVTLQKSGWHLVQIVGEEDADGVVISDCIMRDAYEQMIKVSINLEDLSRTADGGLIENCLFEYSAGIGPQYYIGGIDAHGAKNWIVRSNTFRSIISPGPEVAEFAIHFWNGSSGVVVERNVIIDCDRGIGFGLEQRGNRDGIIRNNMIYHSPGRGSHADVGISLMESPGTQVYNNTIFMENDFPWAIEYRFQATTQVLIANNLTNKQIVARDGASGTVRSNVVNAARYWFVEATAGDLHLSSAVSGVVNTGTAVTGLSDDFDGDARLQDGDIDVGADEWRLTALPMPPTNFRVQ